MYRRIVVTLAASILLMPPIDAQATTVPVPSPPILIWKTTGTTGCWFFYSSAPNGPLGYGPSFDNQTGKRRTVADVDGFFSLHVPADSSRWTKMHAAGTYVATCDGANAKVVFKSFLTAPASPGSATFPVTWADDAAGADWRYDVRFRIGTGSWKSWKHNTTVRSHTFPGASNRTYYLEARVTNPLGGTTKWSPPRKVTT
jgi:hypothetical protein